MPTLTHKINQRIAPQTYTALMTVAHTQGLMKEERLVDGGYDALMHVLIARYTQPAVSTEQLFPLMGLTSAETDYVFDVLEKTGADIAKELRTGFLARIKTLDKSQDQLSRIDLDNPESRKRRKGAGEQALVLLVAQLMADNDAASESTDKVFLSSGLLLKVGRVGKGTVAQFQHKYVDLLNTHHAKHGWYDAKQGQKHNQFTSRKYRALAEQYGEEASA